MPGIYCNLGVRLGRAGLEAREEKNPLLRALEPISGLSTKSRPSCCEGGGQAKGEEREGGGGKVGVLFYLLLLGWVGAQGKFTRAKQWRRLAGGSVRKQSVAAN